MIALSRDLEPVARTELIDENSIKRQISEIVRDGFRNYSVKYKEFVDAHAKRKTPATQELFDQEMIPIIETFLGETTSELNRAFNTLLHPVKDRQHLTTVMQHMQNITQNALKNNLRHFKETAQ